MGQRGSAQPDRAWRKDGPSGSEEEPTRAGQYEKEKLRGPGVTRKSPAMPGRGERTGPGAARKSPTKPGSTKGIAQGQRGRASPCRAERKEEPKDSEDVPIQAGPYEKEEQEQ